MIDWGRIIAGIALVCALVWGGFWIKGSIEARKDLKTARAEVATEQNTAAGYDGVVTEKIREDARVDAGVNRNATKRRELKSRDQAYREYLDRPLPAATLRLYSDAAEELRAAEHPGVDGAVAGDDKND